MGKVYKDIHIRDVMISIIITSYYEPETIGKAIEGFLSQKIKEPYELYVCAPDNKTLNIAKGYGVKTLKDPGTGKTNAINLLLPKLKGEIIILSDGDVYTSEDSVNKILKQFEDKDIGCVTGRPYSINNIKTMFGYWSHLLCYAAHRLRKKRNKEKKFLECSGYLWAFRNHVIKQIPKETAEDTIVPCLFYLKGYRIAYVSEAKVYIEYPTKLKSFVEQKVRCAKGHETLGRYVDLKKIPRMKSLKNEILESYVLISFMKNPRDIFYTIFLFPLRLYIWMAALFKLRMKKDEIVDGRKTNG